MKKLIALVFVATLVGCASSRDPVAKPVDLDILSAAAMDIRAEMKKLNAGGIASGSDPVITGCAERLVSIDFDGDAMLFVDDLRKSAFCDVRVTGKKPRQELILSLHHRKVPLWKVLEDAGVQLGNMALITVAPQSVLFTFGARVAN